MNLSVKGRIDMGEVIVITSGKGGVGKTTTTANIGIGLSQLQKKVVVIDTDLGLRNLDVVMGLENRIVYNLVDVIEMENPRTIDQLILDQDIRELYEAFDTCLTESEKQVITMRYGLFREKEHTQREVAGVLGISRSYVSRIEKKAIGKMRDVFEKHQVL